MKRNYLILTLLLAASLCFSSCSSIFLAAYGIKSPERIENKVLLKTAKKYGIPTSEIYLLDTAYYAYLETFDNTLYREQINNHFQPLQALYYNKDGNLRSFHINCYAGGFPNLKWNRNGNFDTFLPKQQAPLDSILPLQVHLKYLQSLSGNVFPSSPDYDYYVIVYWNKFMGRQSKNLVKQVQANANLASEKKIQIMYVNSDLFFYLFE
ncbi:MAG: hypothetical protein FGM41_01340 [Bacteroidetes bacterium]|nr:hypothetical protein [Bacteroidota bacterium]